MLLYVVFFSSIAFSPVRRTGKDRASDIDTRGGSTTSSATNLSQPRGDGESLLETSLDEAKPTSLLEAGAEKGSGRARRHLAITFLGVADLLAIILFYFLSHSSSLVRASSLTAVGSSIAIRSAYFIGIRWAKGAF